MNGNGKIVSHFTHTLASLQRGVLFLAEPTWETGAPTSTQKPRREKRARTQRSALGTQDRRQRGEWKWGLLKPRRLRLAVSILPAPAGSPLLGCSPSPSSLPNSCSLSLCVPLHLLLAVFLFCLTLSHPLVCPEFFCFAAHMWGNHQMKKQSLWSLGCPKG